MGSGLTIAEIGARMSHPSERGLKSQHFRRIRDYNEFGCLWVQFSAVDGKKSSGWLAFDMQVVLEGTEILPEGHKLVYMYLGTPKQRDQEVLHLCDLTTRSINLDDTERFRMNGNGYREGFEVHPTHAGFPNNIKRRYRYVVGGERAHNELDVTVDRFLRAYVRNLQQLKK